MLVSLSFRFYFTPLRVLFTFPLTVLLLYQLNQTVFRVEVVPVSHRVSRVLQGYSELRLTNSLFTYGALTSGRPSHAVRLALSCRCVGLAPVDKSTGLPSSAFARHYLRNLCCSLPRPYLDISSSGRFPTYAYLIQRTLTEYCSAGFPRCSKSCGSMLMCSSPQLSQLVCPSSAPDAKAFPLRSFWLDLSRTLRSPGLSKIMQASDSVHCSVLPPFFKVHKVYFVTSLLLARNLHCFTVQFSRCRLPTFSRSD